MKTLKLIASLGALSLLTAAALWAAAGNPAPGVFVADAETLTNSYGGGTGNPAGTIPNSQFEGFSGGSPTSIEFEAGAGNGGGTAFHAFDGNDGGWNASGFSGFFWYADPLGPVSPEVGWDITVATTLTFDARLDGPADFTGFGIRFEDALNDQGGEFNQTTVPIASAGNATPTDTYQTYTYPLNLWANPATFSGGLGDAELDCWTRLVFTGPGGAAAWGLKVDNITITGGTVPVELSTFGVE